MLHREFGLSQIFTSLFRAFVVAALLALSSAMLNVNAMAAGYSAQAGRIYDANGNEIRIRGVSHFGFNTPILQPQYLWRMGWKEQIADMKRLGFNAIRVPFVPDTLYNTTPVDQLPGAYVDPNLNPELLGKRSLAVLDLWMAEAERQGMYVLLDFHSVTMHLQYPVWFMSNPGEYNSLIYDRTEYTTDEWVRDLELVARRYAHLPHFLGIDLYNEPHDQARWGNVGGANNSWKAAAERAAAAVLAANAELLIFVQGISDASESASSVPINWGENFQPQANQPLAIPSDKLVLSPHTYGPDVFQKTSFSAANFPSNLAADWDTLFGQFRQAHTIVVGEWGGKYAAGTQDRAWQQAFASYLISRQICNGFYWVYTENSADTQGIIDSEGRENVDKMALLRNVWNTCGAASLTVFDDTVTPLWQLSSWSGTATIQSQLAKSGTSAVKVETATYGGFTFDSRNQNWEWADQPAARYTQLSFDVSAGPVVGSAMGSLEASLDLGYGTAVRIANHVPSFAPGMWYHVEISLSAMNPQGVPFRRIMFQNNSTSNLTYYIDNVRLVSGNGSTPPQPPPPPPPPPSTQLQSCAGIMPLGDSITLGVNGGYRNNLYTGLQQNNCGVDFVGSASDSNTHVVDHDHEGHSGITIPGIAQSANAWLAASAPNVILLMIGTNDTAWWTNEDGVQTGAHHNALISQLQAARPNAWIFVASVPPQSSQMIHGRPDGTMVDRAVLVQEFNSAIRANVNARVNAGQKVRFVDVSSVLSVADLYDGIHPTEEAHAKIAQKFLDALREALAAP